MASGYSTEHYLQNWVLIMQNRICLPGSPHQDVSMDIFNGSSCHKAGVCLLYILVTLFDWSFSQDPQRNPYFVLGPFEVEHSVGYQKVNIGSHLLHKGGRPKVKNPPCIFLINKLHQSCNSHKHPQLKFKNNASNVMFRDELNGSLKKPKAKLQIFHNFFQMKMVVKLFGKYLHQERLPG